MEMLEPVDVEMMTKKEVLNDVRTLTFRVVVKPADYQAALKLEVWSFRGTVRHDRAPRRDRSGHSVRSGGQINTNGASWTLHASGGQHACISIMSRVILQWNTLLHNL